VPTNFWEAGVQGACDPNCWLWGGEKDSFEGFGNVQHQGLEGEEAKDCRLGLASGERC